VYEGGKGCVASHNYTFQHGKAIDVDHSRGRHYI